MPGGGRSRSDLDALLVTLVDRVTRRARGSNWAGRTVTLRFRFGDFAGAIGFVDRMAAIAESEGHHPNFCVEFGSVDVRIWTHAIAGLSENDFILAAKIDAAVVR